MPEGRKSDLIHLLDKPEISKKGGYRKACNRVGKI
jgi:hypothetical protein